MQHGDMERFCTDHQLDRTHYQAYDGVVFTQFRGVQEARALFHVKGLHAALQQHSLYEVFTHHFVTDRLHH